MLIALTKRILADQLFAGCKVNLSRSFLFLIMSLINQLLWSTRKLHIKCLFKSPIMDIGSGGNPSPFADILVEKSINENFHRYHDLVADRPTILADCNKLPFKDKSIEYSLLYHVLEHLDKPSEALDEISRVCKAGYIETPNSLHEILFPLNCHINEVDLNSKNLLCIRRKSTTKYNEIEICSDSELKARAMKAIKSNPKFFHTCYHWNKKIIYNYKTFEEDAGIKGFTNEALPNFPRSKWKRELGSIASKFICKARRLKKIDVVNLLQCPICNSDLVNSSAKLYIYCANKSCNAEFKISNTIYDLLNAN